MVWLLSVTVVVVPALCSSKTSNKEDKGSGGKYILGNGSMI